jgi:hypothetical protein
MPMRRARVTASTARPGARIPWFISSRPRAGQARQLADSGHEAVLTHVHLALGAGARDPYPTVGDPAM